MHSPDCLGIEANYEPGYATPSPNLVYMITEEGGHVGWPTNAWGGSSFLRSAVVDFVSSSMQPPRLDFHSKFCDVIRRGGKTATMVCGWPLLSSFLRVFFSFSIGGIAPKMLL
jgi:hypothetical protein